MKKRFISIFFSILILGIVLRFYNLGNIPNSMSWDEVSWGYNAYSILKTGQDEHGAILPLSFKAFGDFKQPVYVYLQVLPIAIFGLNEFSVRFPSALFGSLSIIFVYLLVYEIFRGEKYGKIISLLAMFSFSLSPWSIQFSRVAYEANVGLFFVISGVWLFLRGVYKNKILYLFLASLVLAISTYTYHSEKIFTPLLVFGLFIYNWKFFNTQKKLAFILFLFFVILNSFWLFDARTTARGRSVTFTSHDTEILKTSTGEIIQDERNKDALGKIFHNRRFVYLSTYLKNYLSHFDLNYLFIKGDQPRHHAPAMGILYLLSFSFIVVGIVHLIRKREFTYVLVFYWFLLAPAPSALTVDSPNASRSMTFLPMWDIFIAVGLYVFWKWIRKLNKQFLIIIVASIFLSNIMYYLHQYFMHTNTDFGLDWQYGYEQAVQSVREYQNNGRRIFFAKDVEQGYIFYLFYNQYDPKKYLASGGSDRIDQRCVAIDQVYFGDCEDRLKAKDVYISSKSTMLQDHIKELKKIQYRNGKTAITIYEYL